MLYPNLKMIDVQGNRLATLPEELADLKLLERLILNNNLIVRLPSKLRQLVNLTHLGAS